MKTDHLCHCVSPSSGIQHLQPLTTLYEGAKNIITHIKNSHLFANRNKDIHSYYTLTSPGPSFPSSILAISISGHASRDRSELSFHSDTTWGCRAFCQAKYQQLVNYNHWAAHKLAIMTSKLLLTM